MVLYQRIVKYLLFAAQSVQYKITSLWQENEEITSKLFLVFRPSKHSNQSDFIEFQTNLKSSPCNRVKSTRYNLMTFLPCTFYNQFSMFFNLFYLLIGLSQFVPMLQVGPVFTFLGPLSFVVFLSVSAEAYDEIKRYTNDRSVNRRIYEKIVAVNESTNVTAEHIKCGDILRLQKGQIVPCDLLLLRIRNDEKATFIRTEQLDGETDWKMRLPVSLFTNEKMQHWSLLNGYIEYEAPNENLYEFNGICCSTSSTGERKVTSLNLQNTIWRGSVLTNGPIIGVVIYTGSQCRYNIEKVKTETKIGIFYQEVNHICKMLCVVLLLVSAGLTYMRSVNSHRLVTWIRFVLLLSAIIPISLRVNLDFAKFFYQCNILKHKELKDVNIRNSSIHEELGRINVLLSDKTGTLTQNKMKLVAFVCDKQTYSCDSLLAQLKRSRERFLSLWSHRSRCSNIKQLLLCLALCHSVFPINDTNPYYDKPNLQASSPDELAFVSYCSEAGIQLISRTSQEIILSIDSRLYDFTEITSKLTSGKTGKAHELFYLIDFEIVYTIPFTSDRKRMGVIIYNKLFNEYIYIVKGADCVILPRVLNRCTEMEHCVEAHARSGMRTLYFAYKVLTASEISTFLHDVNSNLTTNSSSIFTLAEELLDKELTLVGSTIIEDLLQEDVYRTIQTLNQAKIQVWMLTGDKAETAFSIATSTGIKRRIDDVYVFQEEDSYDLRVLLGKMLTFLSEKRANIVISLDNACVTLLTQVYLNSLCESPTTQLINNFFQACLTKRAVLVTRCSPSNKSNVVIMLKKSLPKLRLCTIGDGGNDIPMIRAGHCGIGIDGAEGRHASLASDVSIVRFCQLRPLFLVHGRLSQFRSYKLSRFILQRGLIIGIIQIFFASLFYFTPIPIFQGWLLVGYSTYYTMIAAFTLIFDVDISDEAIYQYPELYVHKDKNDLLVLNDLCFFQTLSLSIYQGSCIVLLSLYLFGERLEIFVIFSFTSLILCELLNIVTTVTTWCKEIMISLVLSIIIYIVSIFLLPQIFDIELMIKFSFISRIFVITLASWMPYHALSSLIRYLSPPLSKSLSIAVQI